MDVIAFPADVLDIICQHLPPRTLHNFMLSSKHVYSTLREIAQHFIQPGRGMAVMYRQLCAHRELTFCGSAFSGFARASLGTRVDLIDASCNDDDMIECDYEKLPHTILMDISFKSLMCNLVTNRTIKDLENSCKCCRATCIGPRTCNLSYVRVYARDSITRYVHIRQTRGYVDGYMYEISEDMDSADVIEITPDGRMTALRVESLHTELDVDDMFTVTLINVPPNFIVMSVRKERLDDDGNDTSQFSFVIIDLRATRAPFAHDRDMFDDGACVPGRVIPTSNHICQLDWLHPTSPESATTLIVASNGWVFDVFSLHHADGMFVHVRTVDPGTGRFFTMACDRFFGRIVTMSECRTLQAFWPMDSRSSTRVDKSVPIIQKSKDLQNWHLVCVKGRILLLHASKLTRSTTYVVCYC